MRAGRRRWTAGAAAWLGAVAARAQATAAAMTAFDHGHAAWTALLRRHVRVLRGGQASELGYAGLLADRAALASYLDALSTAGRSEVEGWSRPQRQAFLINAYNAFTVELVLSRYPALQSIRELGGLLQGPWKRRWIPLLGEKASLDDIEHGMLRARGAYDDPRVHFALNCASVGCPMLREEAYVAERLDAQLDDQARRFMSDRSRNRWSAARGRLELSRIFDWYGEDFRLGHRGIASLAAFAARHAELLADGAADRERIRGASVPIAFLEYDWSLNDAR